MSFLSREVLTFLCLLFVVVPSEVNMKSEVEVVIAGEKEKESKCTYFYDRTPSREAGLVNCTWYSSNSCCKRTEVTSVFSNMDPLYGASVLCKNYINYLMCYFCSPEQYKFYKAENKKAMVCPEYCDDLYEECKTAGFNKTLFEEKYENGTAFCQAQDFEVVDSADCFKFDPDVFGSSNKLISSKMILLTLLILNFISLIRDLTAIF